MVRRPWRRPPRHVDRSDEPQPDDRRPRSGRVDHPDARPAARMESRAPAGRTNVSRVGGRPDPVQSLRQQAGWSWLHRHEHQPPRCGGGNPRITRNYWHTINNGENGWAIPDPVNPDGVLTTGSGSGSIGGIVQRYEEK